MTIKTVCVFVIFMIVLASGSAQTSGSDRKQYDSDWLPPPVSASGDQRTLYADKEHTEQAVPEKKSDVTVSGYTSVEDLHAILNTRLAGIFFYPEQAKKRKTEGVVSLILEISKSGKLLSWQQKGNPPDLLLQATVKQVQSVFPLPVTLEKPVSDFIIRVVYKLG